MKTRDPLDLKLLPTEVEFFLFSLLRAIMQLKNVKYALFIITRFLGKRDGSGKMVEFA